MKGGGGSLCKSRSLKLPLLLDITLHQNFESLCPSTDCRPLIFRQILPKILSVTHIFSDTFMTNLKTLTGKKSLHTKQFPAALPLRIIPLNLYGKHWGWGRIPANSQNLLISLTRKIFLNKFTSSTIRRFIPSPSNSNLHLIILYKLHLYLQSLLLYHFFLTSVFICMHMSC